MSRWRLPRPRRAALVAVTLATTVVCFGGVAGSAPGQSLTKITVNTLPIANALPLTLGINKGFFAAQGLEIERKVFQSGNDIVIAMANNNGDVGYIGYTPGMIGRTQGYRSASWPRARPKARRRRTTGRTSWSRARARSAPPPTSSVRRSRSNALKGVGEVVVKGALEKSGVDPDSVKYTVMPFPTMPSALANGLVDAVHTPEPFMSQILAAGGRIVMAPGPVLGRYWPNGCYCAREDWIRKNPGLAKRFRTAINQSLVYSNSHPDEIRALLPAAIRDIRLPTWSPLIDRVQLLELAVLAKKYGAISTLPNMTKFAPSFVEGGRTLQGTVGPGSFITLRLDGKVVTKLRAGNYTVAIADKSAKDNFHLSGVGLNRSTSVAKKENATWILALKKGVYQYSSDGSSKKKGTFRVT